MVRREAFLIHMLMLAGLFLIAGCTAGLAPYGGKIKKMYRDQITIDIVLPANAPSISQQFHRLPKNGAGTQRLEHLGIDIKAARGTPVLAAADGQVVRSLFEPVYGHTIEIDHGVDGQGRKIKTVYKHLAFRDVAVGDRVERGRKLGGLGRTGVLSSGILHLHFEVQQADETGKMIARDPSLFWALGVGRATCFNRAETWPAAPFKITYPVKCK